MREEYRQNSALSSSVYPPLAFTSWGAVTKTKGASSSCSWSIFCERLQNPKACPNKNELPGWAPALFKEDTRSLPNCLEISALVLDYEKRKPMTPKDRAKATPEKLAAEDHYQATVTPTLISEAIQLWRASLGALHTSYSHTPESPRFRVVLPFTRLVTPKEYTRLWAWMFQHIKDAGHSVDEGCKDPSRLWYVPGYPPEGAEFYEARVWDGSPLDVDALLAELPPEAPPKAPPKAPKTPEKARAVVSATPRAHLPEKDALNAEERARLYLQKMDAAISGQGGHNATYRAACAMVLGFDLNPEAALSLLLSEFNPRCSPQWTERELRHKVESANKESGPRGHLLEVKKERSLSPVITRPKEKTLNEELQTFTRTEAALHIQNAVHHSLSLKNQIGVVVVPYAGGKSDAVRRLVASWDTLRGEQEPFPVPLALLTNSHKLAIESKARAELLGIDTARYFSPPGSGGPRENREHGKPGPLVCIKPRPTVEGHSAAGVPGHKQCFGCPKFDTCKAASGRLGPENALLQIGVHHSPTLPLENAKGLIVDEWPEIVQTHIITLKGLKELAKGCISLLPETRRVLKAAAKAVLSWLEKKAPKEEDPLASHREDLNAIAVQDDGNIRAELARDPEYRPNRANEDKGALNYKDSWRAGKALISAAIENGTLYNYGDGSAAWNGLSRVAKALAQQEHTVILTATPGDFAELEKATGKKAIVIKVPIRPIAPIQNVLKYNTSSTRSGYLDSHGRPRWQKPPAKPGQKPRKAPLVQDLEDLTTWLQERPLIRSLLLGTYRTVALALRLLWAKFRAIEANPEDTDAWNELHAGNVEKAVGKASQARAALSTLFTLLQEREITLDVIWYHAGAGLNQWREEGREFDGGATLGDANPPLDEHRKRYANARNLDLSVLAEDDGSWQAAYNTSAANETGQVHGRLGDVGRPSNRPAWHLHIGATIPAGWEESPITELPRRPKHRPARQAPPEAEGWQEVLSAAVEEQGSVAALATLWKVKPGTLRHSTREGRTPNEAILTQLKTWHEERARGGRGARPESPINTIGGAAIGLSGRSLETGPQEPHFTAAEVEEPRPPWLAPTPLAPNRGIGPAELPEEEKGRKARAEILEACFGVSPWLVLARALRYPRLESLGESAMGLSLTQRDVEPSLSLETAEQLAAYLETYQGTTRGEAEERTLAAYSRLVRTAPIWALCDAVCEPVLAKLREAPLPPG